MRRQSARKPAGFNLAFLDIMACGLGAILLIFMLVKYRSDAPDAESNTLQTTLLDARRESSAIETSNDALTSKIDTLKHAMRQKIARSTRSATVAEAAAQEIMELTEEIARLQEKNAASVTPPDASDEKTPQGHLLGLRVRGSRIVILLDNSASMTAQRLVDISKIKSADMATKKAAPKWQRALAVAHWIMQGVPASSHYMLINYNAKPHFPLGKKWLSGADGLARSAARAALDELVPSGATNLHAALASIKPLANRPTDIYLITDSLPTQGKLSALQRAKACGFQSRSKNKIYDACRLALFDAAVNSFAGVDARVNTVLLPIQGDPKAAHAYWLWAASTHGLMLSPAAEWP